MKIVKVNKLQQKVVWWKNVTIFSRKWAVLDSDIFNTIRCANFQYRTHHICGHPTYCDTYLKYQPTDLESFIAPYPNVAFFLYRFLISKRTLRKHRKLFHRFSNLHTVWRPIAGFWKRFPHLGKHTVLPVILLFPVLLIGIDSPVISMGWALSVSDLERDENDNEVFAFRLDSCLFKSLLVTVFR